MSNKLTLKLNKDKFSDLISKLQDLTNIEDVIKIKIDKENLLIYSLLSNDVSVLALKNYSLNTQEYIDNFDSEYTFDYIICGATKAVKNLKFFNSDSPIKLEVNYKESPDDETIMHVRGSHFSNGKLKVSIIGGEQQKIRDINREVLESRLNIKNSKWGFKLLQQDFMDIKKLCSINSEDKIVNINISNGEITFSENSKWELNVDKVESNKNTQLTFNKKYLSNISADSKFVNFNIFETFILVKDDNSNLMMSFEQNFDNEDD